MFVGLNEWLFNSSDLTPHGFCLLWQPWLIWIYAISDCLIGLAYFSIPIVLMIIARKRSDLVLRPLLWLFAAFILLCGTTHWLDVMTLWVPAYGLEGLVKGLTAIVSIFAAFALWRLLPQALTLPSPAQLRAANAALLASQEQLSQSQKMDAVGQLTGGIAHDFNNMLQAITSSLTLVDRRIKDGRYNEIEKYMVMMRQASESACALTNRLLAFSRRQALQPKAVEPDTLINGIEELIRRTLGPAIKLELLLDCAQWTALCDPNQLENALVNLSINARDAMPDGGVLQISTRECMLTPDQLSEQDEIKPGRYVEICVSDTGIGMTTEIMSHVFEPFFTTKPTGMGTGLGLSQVYGFVKQSDGLIRLESAPNEGLAAHLYLPAHDIPAEKPCEETSPARSIDFSKTQQTRRTVLIVEDQDNVRTQIVDVLSEMGCVLVEAADGPAGLRIVQSGMAFDLLITDVGLPGLNGRQLADAARSVKPHLPILLITGYAGAALDDCKLGDGMIVLPKPFSIEAFVEQVRHMLEPSLQPN